MRRIQTVEAGKKRTQEQIQTFRGGRRNTFFQINDVTWGNKCWEKVKKNRQRCWRLRLLSGLVGAQRREKKSHKGSETGIQIKYQTVRIKPTNQPQIKGGFRRLTMRKEARVSQK